MRIEELARAIDARLILPSSSGNPSITSVYGGATMSDLMANAAPGTLLVTSLNNPQLIRVADLMDVPGICLVDGCVPSAQLVSQARTAGTALLVSPAGLPETCARALDCISTETGRLP
jgi:hypothetical protein